MVLDEFGRCARCVKLGFWKPDAWYLATHGRVNRRTRLFRRRD